MQCFLILIINLSTEFLADVKADIKEDKAFVTVV